jgi:hypothetical protein
MNHREFMSKKFAISAQIQPMGQSAIANTGA